jgi:osmotically-inducible protein OsmY
MEKSHRVVSLLLCVVLVAALVGCAGTPKRESTGEYVDDAAITAKVKAAIAQESALSAFQVNVETFKGVVQLSGFVDTPRNKTRAGEVAAGVKGVKSVMNNIVVK